MQDSPTYLLADGFLPIIIFAIIAGGQLLFRSLASKNEVSDEEAAEAEQKHNEEMRRKIRERMEAARQANRGNATIPQPPMVRVERPRMQEPVVVKAPVATRQAPPVSSMSEDPVHAMQKRIQALKERGMQAQHKMAAIQSQKKSKVPTLNTGEGLPWQGSLRASLKYSLNNSRSAKQAILMAEVLGKPKGLQ